MSEPTQAELRLVAAKAECFRVCGALASDPTLAAAGHEEHRAELEAAYKAFQEASGLHQQSNPASGWTQIDAHLVVEAGVNHV